MINPPSQHRSDQHRPHRPDPIASEQFDSGAKRFFLDLHENDRGRVVHITEDVRGRRDRIMLPFEAIDDMIASLEALKSHE